MPAAIPWKETSQYKRLTFTVNLGDVDNFEDYDLKALTIEVKSSFCIAGRETGAEGRKHFQGYMEFTKKRYGKAIMKAFRKTFPLPLSVHFEVPYSTPEKNIEYCSKEDKVPFVRGEVTLDADKPKGGQRNDCKDAMDMVETGATMLDVAKAYPTTFCQYGRGLDRFKALLAPKRSAPSQSIYLWGPTGTGKTMHAQELDPTTVYWTGNFLNGYHGSEEVILFDDFDYKKMDWQTFLTITDRYAMTINVKGGFANFAPKTIIFTSNSDPKEWYPDVPAHTREAIHRRMNEYGEIRFLGTLVPKEQNILTKFLIKKPREMTIPGAAAEAAPVARPTPMIIDLTEDTDSDDGLSVIALKRRYAVGKYKYIPDESQTDEEDEEEAFCSPIVNRTDLFQHDTLGDK